MSSTGSPYIDVDFANFVSCSSPAYVRESSLATSLAKLKRKKKKKKTVKKNNFFFFFVLCTYEIDCATAVWRPQKSSQQQEQQQREDDANDEQNRQREQIHQFDRATWTTTTTTTLTKPSNNKKLNVDSSSKVSFFVALVFSVL
jgi:hypothetical protein